MKNLVLTALAVAILALTTSAPASAEWTRGRIACIKAAGYATADWEAYRVPPGPAAKYRACRAKADARAKWHLVDRDDAMRFLVAGRTKKKPVEVVSMKRLLMISFLLTTAAAHAGGSILRVGPAQGLPGCRVFIMPNGHQWRAMHHDISAGGKCPPDFMSGRMAGRNQVRLGNGATCTFDDSGNGTCR
jgi:hypothetical protein